MLCCVVSVRVGAVLQTSRPVKSASLQAVLVMASGSSSFQDRNQPFYLCYNCKDVSGVSDMLQREKVSGCCQPARGSECHQLFALLSRTEQHSALLVSKVFIFLFLSCWQR